MEFTNKKEFKTNIETSAQKFSDNATVIKTMQQEIKGINERISNEISDNIRQITKSEADKIVEDMK